jgi:hypothetical protein
VEVSASERSTGAIDVVEGEHLAITATGSASYGYQGGADENGNNAGESMVDPAGELSIGGTAVDPKIDDSAMLPSAAVGSLIAQVDGGAWFEVGDSWQGDAPASGTLLLAFNDEPNSYSDNSGSYRVQIDSGGAPSATSAPDTQSSRVPPPAPTATRATLSSGGAARTTCQQFSMLDANSQANVVQRMLEELNQTSWGVDVVLPNVRAMCAMYPSNTPISVTMSG